METQHALYPTLPRGRGEIMAKADIPDRRCEAQPQGADPLSPSSTSSQGGKKSFEWENYSILPTGIGER
jgi:hypothetical protein